MLNVTDEQLPTRASLRAARKAADTAAAEAPRTGAEPSPTAPSPTEPSATGSTPAATPVRRSALGARPADAPGATAGPATPPGNSAAAPEDGTAPATAATPVAAATPAQQHSHVEVPALSQAPDDRSEDADGLQGPAHARSARTHHVVRGLAIAAVAVFAFTATGAGVVYAKLNGNVKSLHSIENLTKPDDPAKTAAPPNDPSAGTPLNYLLVGSDDRSGENGKLTDHASGGMRSDTTIVMHVSANRKRVDIVSIPRDTMVQIPSCTMTNGKSTGATFGMFNSAFAYGADYGGDLESAVACTWKTVESVTGVSLDGAVVVDFTGFKDMVDALGGVPMCIPQDTVSPEADLDLKAGFQTLNGKQALGYARARKGVGQNFDGSDITRTGRQQQLLAAMFNEVKEQNFLTDLPKLYGFADALTKSLTVTDTLKSTKKLVGLAYAMRGIRPKNVTFMTIPIGEYPADRNRVVMTSAADTVWQNMIDDKPIAETSSKPSGSSSSGGSSTSKSTPTQTKTPAREAFNAADKTAVCS